MSHAVSDLAEAHPSWDSDKFRALCKQVCDGKVSQAGGAAQVLPPKTKEGGMKYATLALGLLVTPAVADAACGPSEREFVKCMFDNCAIHDDAELDPRAKGPCDPTPTPGMARSLSLDHYPGLNFDKVLVLCTRVCDGKITPQDALQKFYKRPTP